MWSKFRGRHCQWPSDTARGQLDVDSSTFSYKFGCITALQYLNYLERLSHNFNHKSEAKPQSPLDCSVAVVHLMHCERRLKNDECCQPRCFKNNASATRVKSSSDKPGAKYVTVMLKSNRAIRITLNFPQLRRQTKNGVTKVADTRFSETCPMIVMKSTMRWPQSPLPHSMCQQHAWAQLAASYALAVEVETGDEPSSSRSQSTCHLQRYPLDLVVGRAHSRCAHMQVQVGTEETWNLNAQLWVVTVVDRIPSRASRDGPGSEVRGHVRREDARAGVGQRTAYRGESRSLRVVDALR